MGWRTGRGGRRRDSGDGRLTDAVPALSVIRAVETLRGVQRTPRCRAASRRGYFEVIKPRRGDFRGRCPYDLEISSQLVARFVETASTRV